MAVTPLDTGTPSQKAPSTDIQSAQPFLKVTPSENPTVGPIYFQSGDLLQLFLLSNSTLNTITLKYRFLTPQNEVKEATQTIQNTSLFNGFNFQTTEGWLLSFALQAPIASPPGNWVFAQLAIERGFTGGANTAAYGMIWEGYLPSFTAAGWPGTPAKFVTDGAGIIRGILGTLPGAGGEINETVPANRRWKLLGLRASLTTAVAVANRFARFIFSDGVHVPFFATGSTSVQAASLAKNYCLAPGVQFFDDGNGSIFLPFPGGMDMKAGFSIASATIGLQAADQWSAPSYIVQELGNWDA